MGAIAEERLTESSLAFDAPFFSESPWSSLVCATMAFVVRKTADGASLRSGCCAPV